jgi:putative transposase
MGGRINFWSKNLKMLPERKLNRLLNFDYSTASLYFVTSCVQNREHWFGSVINGKMNLNKYGKIADEQFLWLQNQYPYLIIHIFIIMPNHVHALLEIDPVVKERLVNGIDRECVRTGRDTDKDQECVRTGRDLSLHKIKSVSELMGAYKTTTSKKIRLAGLEEFAWQRHFHDHIIRNEIGYQNIYNYIENNPLNWQHDKFFTP